MTSYVLAVPVQPCTVPYFSYFQIGRPRFYFDFTGREAQVTFHTTPAGVSSSTEAEIWFEMNRLNIPADATKLTFACLLDGQPSSQNESCTSPWRTTGLQDGSHTLLVFPQYPGRVFQGTSFSWRVGECGPLGYLTSFCGLEKEIDGPDKEENCGQCERVFSLFSAMLSVAWSGGKSKCLLATNGDLANCN